MVCHLFYTERHSNGLIVINPSNFWGSFHPVPFMYSLLGAGYVQEIKGGCAVMGNAPSLSSVRYHLNFHSSKVILFPFRTKQRSIVPVIFV